MKRVVLICSAFASALSVIAAPVERLSFSGPAALSDETFQIEADAAADYGDGNLVTTFETSINTESLTIGLPEGAPDGSSAIVPCSLDDGSFGFAGWGDGSWQSLTGCAPSPATWIDIRFELRTLGERTFVSYGAKLAGDAEYTTLTNRSGRAWFRAGADRPASRTVTFVGTGTGNGGSVVDEALAETRTLVAYDGDQTVTTNGVTAMVRDAAFLVDSDGKAEQIGGMCRPVVAFDLGRVRAGKKIEASYGNFLGIDPKYAFAWSKADWQKNYAELSDGVTALPTSSSITPTAADYESWYRLVVSDPDGVVADREFFFSKLPVCYITTKDGGFPTAEKEEHDALIRIQGNDDFKEQYADDDYKSVVKVRGNTSAGYAKKPYKLKLGSKATLCGLGAKKNKHWVLLANEPDPTHMRNKLAFDFANEHAGSYGMKSTWVELILNGRYDGVYQLAEHIRIADDRIKIFDWEGYSEDNGHTAEDLSWIDADTIAGGVEGGWIFELSSEADEVSRFTVTSGNLKVPTMMNAPEYLKTNAKMFSAAQTYLKNYFDACTAAYRKSGEGLGYAAYADVNSMVGYFLVQELFGNQDAGAKSRYAYRDRGGKLTFGPVWDFDHAAGTKNMQKPSPERWHAAQSSFYAEWLSDYRFARKARVKYRAIRNAYSALAAEGGTIDAYVAYLQEAAAANDARWTPVRSFAADVAVLKNFITGHRAWMDGQMETLETFVESTKCDAQTNPCDVASIPPEGTTVTIR